jgi:hypothetical protein
VWNDEPYRVLKHVVDLDSDDGLCSANLPDNGGSASEFDEWKLKEKQSSTAMYRRMLITTN